MAVRNATLVDFTTGFTGGPGFYRGVVVVPFAGTTGSSAGSADGTHTHRRTASASGTGTGSADRTVTSRRTGSGSGTGTGSADPTVISRRTGTGSGSGTGSADGIPTSRRTGSSSGSGAGTADRTVISRRTGSASGAGTGIASTTITSIRTGSASGAGTATGVGRIRYVRTGTASGAGTATADGTKSFTFRPPNDDDFPWADYRQQSSKAHRLFGFVGQGVRARNIFKLVDGTFTNDDPLDPALVDKVYYGAHVYFVTAEEKADLVAAGYEVT